MNDDKNLALEVAEAALRWHRVYKGSSQWSLPEWLGLDQTQYDRWVKTMELPRGYTLPDHARPMTPLRDEPETPEQKLGLLAEELGKALAAIEKARRSPEETNRAWILRELRDLRRAILRVERDLGQGMSGRTWTEEECRVCRQLVKGVGTFHGYAPLIAAFRKRFPRSTRSDNAIKDRLSACKPHCEWCGGPVDWEDRRRKLCVHCGKDWRNRDAY